MAATQETFFIGAFAKAAGVNVETIRFYQRKRLLAEPPVHQAAFVATEMRRSHE
jgi:hypothetical protein